VQEPLDTDVAIVGAGVVGCAIARELTQFDLRVTLLEAGPDVGAGTSKANTALLHTGFDAKPGTLESRLVARGFDLLSDYADGVGIPVERTGALLVAWNEEQLREFPGIVERSQANGYRAIAEVGVDELYRREPHLGPGALGRSRCPTRRSYAPSPRRSRTRLRRCWRDATSGAPRPSRASSDSRRAAFASTRPPGPCARATW
jgi:glycerol-3-phosphate dehydrogenase